MQYTFLSKFWLIFMNNGLLSNGMVRNVFFIDIKFLSNGLIRDDLEEEGKVPIGSERLTIERIIGEILFTIVLRTLVYM